MWWLAGRYVVMIGLWWLIAVMNGGSFGVAMVVGSGDDGLVAGGSGRWR